MGLPGRRDPRRGADNDDTEGGPDGFSPGERYGRVYQINYLRCIFCGLCIEACPTRALTMTNVYELADNNRADLIYTKDQLLAPLQQGMLPPPFPMADGMGGARLLPREGLLGHRRSARAYVEAHTRDRRRGGDLVTGTGEQVMFWVLGPLAVLASLGLLFARKAVHAALGVALTMIILGVFYIAQDADFLGVIQIFVYTGAVIMLFLFVVMLIGVDSSDSLVETIGGQRWATVLLSLGLGGILVSAIGQIAVDEPVGVAAINAQVGNVSVHGATDLRPLRLGLRDHQRAAHHRGARRHGARPPRAPRQGPGPARVEQAALPRGQAPRRPAGPGRLRAPQRRRHPGLLPDGHAVELSVSPGAHRARAEPLPGGLPRGRGRDRARHAGGQRAMSLVNYIYLATILFVIGGATVLTRRNAIIVFMGVELMLNSANLVFVTFARIHGNLDGQVLALFVMVVAAAEVVVGLAIIMAIFRSRRSASVDDANLLKL